MDFQNGIQNAINVGFLENARYVRSQMLQLSTATATDIHTTENDRRIRPDLLAMSHQEVQSPKVHRHDKIDPLIGVLLSMHIPKRFEVAILWQH